MRTNRASRLVLLGALALPSCTSSAPWGVEGSAGAPCFPDRTCDPSLICARGVCASSSGGDQGLPDEASPRSDRFLPALDRAGRDLLPCTAPPPPPVVLPYSKTTVLDRLAIRGSAPGAVEIEVNGSGASQTVKVTNDLFCIELQLKKNAQNGFQLRARDKVGCESAPAFVGIVQSTAGPVNLLYSLTAKTKDPPSDGNLASLTDGQITASVKFSFTDPELTPSTCDYFEHLWFDLGSSQSFDQFVVRYPQKSGFKYYLTCWELLVSNVAKPAAPDPKHPDWTSIAKQESGAPSQLSIPLPGAKARHLALLMYEDGGSGFWETFELTEVEAWGVAAPPPSETCP